MGQAIGAVSGRKSTGKMLPVLIVLFALCWGLAGTLIILQDRMIDAQGDLIHLLFKAQHRTMIVAQKIRNSRAVEKSTSRPNHEGSRMPNSSDPLSSSASSSQVPLDQAQPSTQVPLSQNASSETPSSQAKPQASTKSGRNSRKAVRPAPAQPPAQLTDPSDMRRVLNSI